MSWGRWAAFTEHCTEFFTSSFRKAGVFDSVCVCVCVCLRERLAAIANHRPSFSFASDSSKRQRVPKRLRETLNCLHCCSGSVCVCVCVCMWTLEVSCTECNRLIMLSNHLQRDVLLDLLTAFNTCVEPELLPFPSLTQRSEDDTPVWPFTCWLSCQTILFLFDRQTWQNKKMGGNWSSYIEGLKHLWQVTGQSSDSNTAVFFNIAPK